MYVPKGLEGNEGTLEGVGENGGDSPVCQVFWAGGGRETVKGVLFSGFTV